jgi:hypothetical protein
LLYINDLNKYTRKSIPYSYADDTVFLIKSKSKTKLLNKLKLTLTDIEEYCLLNNLKINTSKTSIVFINNLQTDQIFLNQCFQLNNELINTAVSFKYLGFNIDNRLKF